MRFGPYEVERELGKGAMGAAYLARDARSGARVVVKTLRWTSPDLLLRFEREARISRRLRHPGIVAALDAGRDESGGPYIVLEHVEGGTLAELIAKGPLEPRRAALIARDLALALDFAHREGVLHRDLKPSNVLMDGRGQPRIADFGLGRAAGDARMSGTGEVLGTPSYLPPEQVKGGADAHGPPGDIWAVGVLLHEMLAGTVPFAAPSHVGLFQAIASGERPPLPASQALDAVVGRCLEKDPAARYASGRELATALEAALVAPKERRGLVVALGVLLVLGVAGGVAAALARHSTPAPPVPAPPVPVAPAPDADALAKDADAAFRANRLEDSGALVERALARDPRCRRALEARLLLDLVRFKDGLLARDLDALPSESVLHRLFTALGAGADPEPADFPSLEPWLVFYARSRIQLIRPQVAQAAESARRAAEVAPSLAAPFVARGVALQLLVREHLVRRDDAGALPFAEDAARALDRAATLCPDLLSDVSFRYERGCVLASLGDRAEAAIAELGVAAVASGPYQGYALFQRARVFVAEHKPERAREDFLAASRIFTPETPDGMLIAAWRSAAECDVTLGRLDIALEEAEHALRLNPVDGFAIATCLAVLRNHPRRDAVVERARKELGDHENDRFLLALLGCALETSGRLAEARVVWVDLQATFDEERGEVLDRIKACAR